MAALRGAAAAPVPRQRAAVMARLTIRQASQQGFASTLAIHRQIKEGALPVYEEGDAKLLEVDDLIAVFGEPAARQAEAAPAPANGPVDMREFNRLKAELEQKNKKNMWLAADLAEVVRELKDKEARFEKERNRLLTVLEQAQALLLREVERAGGRRAPAADAASEAAVAEAEGSPAPAAPSPRESEAKAAALEAAVPGDEPQPPAAAAEPLVLHTALDVPKPGTGIAGGLPPLPPEGVAAPDHLVLPERKENLNPLIPPLGDPNAPRRGRRALGATTWLLLFALAGGGFAFFEFRTKVLMSVNRVLQALS